MTRRSTVPPLGCLAILTALAALTGACAPEGRPGRHVVLILLDAARPDRLGAYDPGRPTSPNLDALAEKGAVFLNHYSQATDTRSSLPRLLYSRYFIQPLFPLSAEVPYSHPSDLFRRLDDEAISLPAVLSARGFHSAMISAHTWLKPETPFAREFDEVHDLSSGPGLESGYPHPRAETVVDFAIEWLERHRERDVFLYLHLMDTHAPRFFDADAAAMFEGDAAEAERRIGTRDRELRTQRPLRDIERRVLDAIYDGSVRYTDRHLGRLFELYREWGVLDRTLIAVTSDHGELLLERPGAFGHGGPWFDLVARVPLIVSYPARLEPRRVKPASESVDLAPTLLGLLDIELPAGKSFDGSDLLAERTVANEPTIGNRALRLDGFKIMFDQSDELLLGRDRPDLSSLSGLLYDLAADPDETDNLWSSRQDVVEAALVSYRRKLGKEFARYRRTRTDRQPESSFAIAARHFRTDRPVPTRATRKGPARGGWVLSNHWWDSYLLALPGAEPLAFEFEIPNGSYAVSVATSGDCKVEPLADGASVPGEVEISDQIFRARLLPGTDGNPCSISYLGFRPAGTAHDDPERNERLRALGYVN